MEDMQKEMPAKKSKDSIEGKKMSMDLKSGTFRFGQEAVVRQVQYTEDGLKIIPITDSL
ncbi:hypothetical protein [Trichococcus flocculiformis]|uniref:hypothetical protein n=1 Tax=Trichococcus flocculiformis TaxID=82803 RepID=UPI003DA67FF5